MDIGVFISGATCLLFNVCGFLSIKQAVTYFGQSKEITKEIEEIRSSRDVIYSKENMEVLKAAYNQNAKFCGKVEILATQDQQPIRLLKDGIFNEHQQYKVVGITYNGAVKISTATWSEIRKAKLQFDEVMILKDGMQFNYRQETPKDSFWYQVINFFNIQDKELRYCPVQTEVTLTPQSLAIVGTLKFDELAMQTLNINVKYIARQISSILTFLQKTGQQKLLVGVGASCWAAIFYGASYLLMVLTEFLYDRNKKARQHLSQAKQISKLKHINYVMVDKTKGLKCLQCHTNTVNMVYECGHMNVCYDCSEVIKNCRQCGKFIENPIKIYMS